MTEADWDPELGAREWFTHRYTGDRGFRVRRAGKDVIRLDRPADPFAIRPLTEEWLKDEGWRPLTVGQRAQVAFDADRSLCRSLGLHAEAKKTWNDLSDSERIRWTERGPTDPTRAGLYAVIMEWAKDLAR